MDDDTLKDQDGVALDGDTANFDPEKDLDEEMDLGDDEIEDLEDEGE